jgi:magnesium transporter
LAYIGSSPAELEPDSPTWRVAAHQAADTFIAVILDCAVYEDGKRRAGNLALADASAHCFREGAFVWLGMHEPSEEEFDSVQREFELHELAVEDAVDAHQRPKLELYGDTLFMVLKTLRFVPETGSSGMDVETGEIMIFANSGFLITVRHGQASALHDVRLELERNPDRLRHGPAAALHAILDRVVDDYDLVVDRVGLDIQDVEEEVFAPHGANPAHRIYTLEREVLQFHRAVAPLIGPVERLARGHYPHVHDELTSYFRDVHDHLLRVQQEIAGYRELLASVLQANLAQLTVRQNDNMRRISAWVAIAAVPTLVAGLYGMNFRHMPELRWEYGYPLVLGIVFTICSTLWWKFHRSGWL